MKIGIFFGGQSREREVSFAGGRTIYDNLNKQLFDPIPVFVDSFGRFIVLDWKYIYKGSIRDFYPPVEYIPENPSGYQYYAEHITVWSDRINDAIGYEIPAHRLSSLIDFAFLSLHGPYGEDGNIQGLLEWYDIPYSGSGILSSGIGINKIIQKQMMQKMGFSTPDSLHFSLDQWLKDPLDCYHKSKKDISFPLVTKSPGQGSSIGVNILKKDDYQAFKDAVNKSFFIKEIDLTRWREQKTKKKEQFIKEIIDFRSSIGLPVALNDSIIRDPYELIEKLNNESEKYPGQITIQAINHEENVLIESFIDGREFSCIVIEDEYGCPLALPPTEIIKKKEIYDYRAKYLPGISRKITPIQLDDKIIQTIRSACERLFDALNFQVYARIDGILSKEGEIFLNDPNTTSGMLPSSFFFHQAAEIGLNPSQFLTYIIDRSLKARLASGRKNYLIRDHIHKLDIQIKEGKSAHRDKLRIGVIMGGYSTERHISVESGRNIYEKLSSSTKYKPIPIFLCGDDSHFLLYRLPINMVLKDNADDILDKINLHKETHPIIKEIIQKAETITDKFSGGFQPEVEKVDINQLSSFIDFAFIALHGRPGEDGALQAQLEEEEIPYNGSGVEVSQLTINKYETNELLGRHGFKVAKHQLVYKSDYQDDPGLLIDEITKKFNFPFIAKPADDGCSSAVKMIKNREALDIYLKTSFRDESVIDSDLMQGLSLKENEEFPRREYVLIEELISDLGANKFMEITGGLLTKFLPSGDIEYEVFEPSQTLSMGEVLSLEEKFLAGEGQNITPAVYDKNENINQLIASKVKKTLVEVAEILRIEGYCRIDAFVRFYAPIEVEVIIIEVNSLPGMTPATCIFHQSAINNYTPYDFIDHIIQYGMERKRILSEGI